MIKNLLLAGATMIFVNANAQKVKVVEGKIPDDLKNGNSINIELTYNNLSVGRYDKEADYIADRKDDLNKKEAGSGDSWAVKWVEDRENRYKPRFLELFNKHSGLSEDPNAKYTLIFNTSFTEPGYNVGVARRKAHINGEAVIVETANKGKVLARISVTKAPGGDFWGADFDTGMRLTETYATAGRGLGKIIKK